MPNVAKVLKAEISRLAKKEARAATQKLRRDTVMLKRRAAEQRRHIVNLVKELRKLSILGRERATAATQAPESEAQAARVSSGMVRRVRARLGLSQLDFGRLVGVSPISVYNWERKEGRLALRKATRAAFVAIRKFGKREARAHLEMLRKKLAPRKPARRPRRTGRRRAKR